MQILECEHDNAVGRQGAERLAQGERQLDPTRSAGARLARERVREPHQLTEQPDLARGEAEHPEPLHLLEALGRGVLGLDPAEIAHEIGERAEATLRVGLVGPAVHEDEVARRGRRTQLGQ